MGPTFSRSIFPFPESTSTKQQAPYFQAPPRLSYRSLLPATPRLCSYEPLISTVIPPPLPQPSTFRERITPIFRCRAKTRRFLYPLFNTATEIPSVEQHSSLKR